MKSILWKSFDKYNECDFVQRISWVHLKKCTWPNNTTRAVKLNKILDTLVFVHNDVVVNEVFGQNYAVFKLANIL